MPLRNRSRRQAHGRRPYVALPGHPRQPTQCAGADHSPPTTGRRRPWGHGSILSSSPDQDHNPKVAFDPCEAEWARGLARQSAKRKPRLRGFLRSGRRDSNSGPLVPQTSALTRLRHAPWPRQGTAEPGVGLPRAPMLAACAGGARRPKAAWSRACAGHAGALRAGRLQTLHLGRRPRQRLPGAAPRRRRRPGDRQAAFGACGPGPGTGHGPDRLAPPARLHSALA